MSGRILLNKLTLDLVFFMVTFICSDIFNVSFNIKPRYLYGYASYMVKPWNYTSALDVIQKFGLLNFLSFAEWVHDLNWTYIKILAYCPGYHRSVLCTFTLGRVPTDNSYHLIIFTNHGSDCRKLQSQCISDLNWRYSRMSYERLVYVQCRSWVHLVIDNSYYHFITTGINKIHAFQSNSGFRYLSNLGSDTYFNRPIHSSCSCNASTCSPSYMNT